MTAPTTIIILPAKAAQLAQAVCEKARINALRPRAFQSLVPAKNLSENPNFIVGDGVTSLKTQEKAVLTSSQRLVTSSPTYFSDSVYG